MSGNILYKAHSLLNVEKSIEYGDGRENMNRIAGMWSAYLGREINGHDVACLMVLLKMAREAKQHKPDNLLDAAGYIGLAADMADTMKPGGSYIGLSRGTNENPD